jgi:virginiamycin B lyase
MPIGIIAGADGALWFTQYKGHRIGRITLQGTITEFPLPTAGAGPNGIALGPDGAIWFAETDIGQVGRITPDGTIVEFSAGITPGSQPLAPTAGGGFVWVSEAAGSAVARVAMDGSIVEFPTPTANSGPRAITPGPDGRFWFVQTLANAIGRIDRDGTVVEFPFPRLGASLRGIDRTPSGDFLITENASNFIARMNVDGDVAAEYAIPTPQAGARSIVVLPDGRGFFSEHDAGQIGELAPEGRRCMTIKGQRETFLPGLVSCIFLRCLPPNRASPAPIAAPSSPISKSAAFTMRPFETPRFTTPASAAWPSFSVGTARRTGMTGSTSCTLSRPAILNSGSTTSPTPRPGRCFS